MQWLLERTGCVLALPCGPPSWQLPGSLSAGWVCVRVLPHRTAAGSDAGVEAPALCAMQLSPTIWPSLPQDPSHPPTFQLTNSLAGLQQACQWIMQSVDALEPHRYRPACTKALYRSVLRPQALPSFLGRMQHVDSPAQRRTRQRRPEPPALVAGLQRPPRQGPCAACNVR